MWDVIVTCLATSTMPKTLLITALIWLIPWSGEEGSASVCARASPVDGQFGVIKSYVANGADEEFLFEHQVSGHEAMKALNNLNESFFRGPSQENSCSALFCDEKIMNYCQSPQFINDHCWCEMGHEEEGLPYVPHICFVSDKVHTASVGSCFFFEEVKECCCASAWARRLRNNSNSYYVSYFFLLNAIMPSLLFVVNHTKLLYQ